jgi:hypothetical protein
MTDPVVVPPIPVPTQADKGTVPKQVVTALLVSSGEWLPVIPGTFDTCEINISDDSSGTSKRVGGVVGFRFKTKGVNGRPALVVVSMAAVLAIQIEEPPAIESKETINNGK